MNSDYSCISPSRGSITTNCCCSYEGVRVGTGKKLLQCLKLFFSPKKLSAHWMPEQLEMNAVIPVINYKKHIK